MSMNQNSTVRTPATASLGGQILGKVQVFPVTAFLLMALSSMMNPMQLASDERISAPDHILISKLLIAACAVCVGTWGVLHSSTIRRMLTTPTSLLVWTLLGLFTFSSFIATGDYVRISRGASLITIGYLLLACTSVTLLGLRRVAIAILIGQLIFILLNWILFLFYPSLGIFYELAEGGLKIPRMGGLGHPNSIAREAGIGALIVLAILRCPTKAAEIKAGNHSSSQSPLDRLFRMFTLEQVALVAVLGFLIATMGATISRTAALATVTACATFFFDKIFSRMGVRLVLAGLALMLAAILFSSLTSRSTGNRNIAEMFTKSGNVDELTSMTGRTVIWQEAIDIISKRPLIGYGMDSAASLMSKEAGATHSLLLHIIFSAGVFAGVVMLVFFAIMIYEVFTTDEPLLRGAMTYVLVSGLVEDTLFASFPSSLTVLWLIFMTTATLPKWLRTIDVNAAIRDSRRKGQMTVAV